MKKGRLYLFISAILYGIAPIFAKIAIWSGSDSTTLVLLRSVLALPPLFLIIKFKGIGFKLSKSDAYKLIIGATLLNVPAFVLLYTAYGGGHTSRASILHFVYPMLIVIISSLFLKRKASPLKWLGVIVALFGVGICIHFKLSSVYELLALFSGLFYAMYVLYLDISGLDKINCCLFTFYLMLAMSSAALFLCLVGNGIKLPCNTLGWLSLFAITVGTNLCAVPLFQLGVELAGAEAAGIISFAEPILTTFIGIFFLGESVAFGELVSLSVMLIGIAFIEKG